MQQDRSNNHGDQPVSTSDAILHAAVESIFELGWTRLSIVEVADRCGVSRGAVRHHFPTREDLATAAIAQLAKNHQAKMFEVIASLPEGLNSTQRLESLVDVLWSMYEEKPLMSWHDLLVAARTDEALSRSVTECEEQLQRTVAETWNLVQVDDDPMTPLLRDFGIRFIFALFDGLSIQCHAMPRFAPEWKLTVITTLKLILRLLPQVPPDQLLSQIDDILGASSPVASPSA